MDIFIARTRGHAESEKGKIGPTKMVSLRLPLTLLPLSFVLGGLSVWTLCRPAVVQTSSPPANVAVAVVLWGRACALGATLGRIRSLLIGQVNPAAVIGVAHIEAGPEITAFFGSALTYMSLHAHPTQSEISAEFGSFRTSEELLSRCDGCQNTLSPVKGSERVYNRKLWEYWWQSKALAALEAHERQTGSNFSYVLCAHWDSYFEHSPPPVDMLQAGVFYSSDEDKWNGINPNIAVMPRKVAPIFLGIWDAMKNGDLLKKLGRKPLPGTSETLMKEWLLLNNVPTAYFYPVSWQFCPRPMLLSCSDECICDRMCRYRDFLFEASMKKAFLWPSQTAQFNLSSADGITLLPSSLRT